jgi:HEAT repeat protein
MKRIFLFSTIAFVTGLFGGPLFAQEKPEPRYEGKPLNYWIMRLQKCEKDEERNAAAEAIKAFGADAAPAIPALVEMLDDRSDNFRRLVGDILCAMGPAAKPAVPALIHTLKEKTARTPVIVISILCAIGPDAHDAVPVLISAIGERPADTLNDSAVEALCNIGPTAKDGIPAIRRLVQGVKGREPDKNVVNVTPNYFFIRNLPNLGREGVALLVEFLTGKDADIQSISAEILGEAGIEAKTAAPQLTKLLQHQGPRVRLSAATALWKIEQNPAVVPVLTSLIKEKDVALSATDSLGEIGPQAKSAIPELSKALSEEWEGPGYERVLNAIQKIDPAEAQKLKQRVPPRPSPFPRGLPPLSR